MWSARRAWSTCASPDRPSADPNRPTEQVADAILHVRQGDDLWKRQLNDVIRKRQADIDKVLLEYGVPMIDEDSKPITTPRS